MATVPRRVRLLAIAVAVAGLAVALLALSEFSSPTLGRALLDRAGAAAGARLQADEFHLSLLRGLSLGRVRAAGTWPGGRYEVTVDRLVFQHRLLPLLAGRLTVDRVRLDRPHALLAETTERASAAPSLPSGTPVAMPIALHVVEAIVDDGTIELRAATGVTTSVRGFGLRLRDLALAPGEGSALARLTGAGLVHATEIAVPVTRARDVAGSLRLAAGRLQADGLRFHTDEGDFRARATVDLTRLPFPYTLGLEGQPLDLNAMAGAAARGGRFGPAHLVLDGSGKGPEPAGLTAKGRLRLEEGTLPATPFLAGLERALGRGGLSGARYKATEAPFRIERGRVFVDALRIESDAVLLDVSGWTSVDGPLELSVAVRVPRAQVGLGDVPAAVLDALTDPGGWIRVPLRVTGTRQAPHVAPDAAALLAEARHDAGRSLANQAAEKLKGLLRH